MKIIMTQFFCALGNFALLLCRVFAVLSLMTFAWCLLAWEQIPVWPMVLAVTLTIGFGGPGFYYDQLVASLKRQIYGKCREPLAFNGEP